VPGHTVWKSERTARTGVTRPTDDSRNSQHVVWSKPPTASVPKAIITHCGSEIVTGDERRLSAKLCAMAVQRGIEVRLAYDGMKLEL
jgi:hypothetical protein